MLYDCFIFFNEEDLLEIRLNELYDKVDHFLLIEGNKTFTGLDKPLYFRDDILGKSWIQPFLPKLNFFTCNLTAETNWEREAQQRNCIREVLYNHPMQDDDLIIISDVDEIPQLPFSVNVTPCDCLTLIQKMYYYFFNNYLFENPWPMAKVATWKYLKEHTPDDIRRLMTNERIECGWHFSFLGDEQKILEKLQAFSHQELKEHFTIENIRAALAEKRDLFNRPDCKMKVVPLEGPKFLLENRERFAKYIL